MNEVQNWILFGCRAGSGPSFPAGSHVAITPEASFRAHNPEMRSPAHYYVIGGGHNCSSVNVHAVTANGNPDATANKYETQHDT